MCKDLEGSRGGGGEEGQRVAVIEKGVVVILSFEEG